MCELVKPWLLTVAAGFVDLVLISRPRLEHNFLVGLTPRRSRTNHTYGGPTYPELNATFDLIVVQVPGAVKLLDPRPHSQHVDITSSRVHRRDTRFCLFDLGYR